MNNAPYYYFDDTIALFCGKKYDLKDKKKFYGEVNASDIERLIESLRSIGMTDLTELHTAYGRIDFLIGNIKLRPWIFNTIYEPLKNTFQGIQFFLDHINFVDQNGVKNIPFIVNKFQEGPSNLFEYEMIDSSNIVNHNLYNKSDSFINRLEELRYKMYKGQFSKAERTPCFGMFETKFEKRNQTDKG